MLSMTPEPGHRFFSLPFQASTLALDAAAISIKGAPPSVCDSSSHSDGRARFQSRCHGVYELRPGAASWLAFLLDQCTSDLNSLNHVRPMSLNVWDARHSDS